MAERFKTFTPAGGWKLKEALVISAGAADVGKIPALNAAGEIDASMLPSYDYDTSNVPSSENLVAGNLVNFWDDAGTTKARKADASSAAKRADGFILAGVTAPAVAAVFHDGVISGLVGLTPGARYYLSASVPGGLALESAVTTTTGHLVQFIGVARSTTELVYQPDVNPAANI
jgi:hypothetical protein